MWWTAHLYYFFLFQVHMHRPNPNQSFRLAIKQSIQHSDINIASNLIKIEKVISSPNDSKIDVRKNRNAATKSEIKNLLKLLHKTRHTKSLRALLKRIIMIKDPMKGYIRLHWLKNIVFLYCFCVKYIYIL